MISYRNSDWPFPFGWLELINGMRPKMMALGHALKEDRYADLYVFALAAALASRDGAPIPEAEVESVARWEGERGRLLSLLAEFAIVERTASGDVVMSQWDRWLDAAS